MRRKVKKRKRVVLNEEYNYLKTKKRKIEKSDDYDSDITDIGEDHDDGNTSPQVQKNIKIKKKKKKKKYPIKFKETTRNKTKREREHMNGYCCNECEKFCKVGAELLNIPVKIFNNRFSRHRENEGNEQTPPKTPEGFWDMNFFKDSDDEKV